MGASVIHPTFPIFSNGHKAAHQEVSEVDFACLKLWIPTFCGPLNSPLSHPCVESTANPSISIRYALGPASCHGHRKTCLFMN